MQDYMYTAESAFDTQQLVPMSAYFFAGLKILQTICRIIHGASDASVRLISRLYSTAASATVHCSRSVDV